MRTVKKGKRKFAQVRKMISPNDDRKKEAREKREKAKAAKEAQEAVKNVPQTPSSLFFKHNTALGPPYQIILDTNFINFSVQNKLDILQSMMDCLYARCIPYITECVIGEIEKLGPKFRIALKVARDPRFERLPCMHKGSYADDCIVERITQHRCYIVATCDKELRKRIRKVPGVPMLGISHRQYVVEQLPEFY